MSFAWTSRCDAAIATRWATRAQKKAAAWLLGSAALLVACGDSKDSDGDLQPMLETYAEVLVAGYDDSVTSAKALQKSMEPLLSGKATESDLANARKAWVTARVPYQQTEFARFYDGPIDDPKLGNLEGMINPWPLDEATIDYVQDPQGKLLFGGIINMPKDFPSITEKVLSEQNMLRGEENVTTGYHALEFLLWGQDLNPNGPGDRPYTDYVDGEQKNVGRRQEYVDVATQLLIEQLEKVRDQWAPDKDNYRAQFVAMPPKQALALILTGMGKFASGELAGQRINAGYRSKDQEDEHSCFSDNTNADLASDVLGLSNVYYGRYTRNDGGKVSGTSLSDVVKSRDAKLDERIRGQVDKALTDIRAWPKVAACPSRVLQGKCPFDQLILGTDDAPGRKALATVMKDLQDLATSVVDIANLFHIQIDISDSGDGK